MSNRQVTRRRALALAGIGTTVGLSGCIGAFTGGSQYQTDVSGGPDEYPDTEPLQYQSDIQTGEQTTVEVYGDYQCPYCADFHNEMIGTLQDRYVNFTLEMYNYPIPVNEFSVPIANVVQQTVTEHGPQSDEAYRVAEYAYTKEIDSLDQFVGFVAGDTALTEASIEDVMESGTYNALLREHISRGDSFGVESTPSVVINGTLLENAFDIGAYDEFLQRQ